MPWSREHTTCSYKRTKAVPSIIVLGTEPA
jgi:hypothetical protein